MSVWNDFALTHTGNVRSNNEDAFSRDPALGLWVVADGMGGHEAGEVASAIAIESITRKIRQGKDIVEAIQNAHHNILNGARKGRGAKGMGSTVVAIHTTNTQYQVAWVGDSRAYLWTRTGERTGTLEQLTTDHSYVQMLVKAGAITPEEAINHRDKNVTVLLRGGHHDGDEHAVEHDPQRRPDGERQDRPGQCAAQRPQRPADKGQRPQPQQERHRQGCFPRHGEGENFIRIEKRDQKPGQQADLLAHPLAQRQTHQGVAAVDDQLRQHHFPQRGGGDDEGQPRELPRAGQIRGGDQHRVQRFQALRHGHGAETEAHRKISHPHRQSTVDAHAVFIVVHK